jgi:hypothetical protein
VKQTLLIAIVVLVTLTHPACGGGPTAAVDWRMVDRTLDVKTDQAGAGIPDTSGPDGVVDDYDNAQGSLVRGVNGNISTKFPQDGRYDVALDGCGSLGAVSYDWLVDTGPLITSTNCEVRVRLTEGPHDVALTVRDASGKSNTAPLALVVRNLIVVGLGDSFSAGSGDSRSGLVALDYDVIQCTRSRTPRSRSWMENAPMTEPSARCRSCATAWPGWPPASGRVSKAGRVKWWVHPDATTTRVRWRWRESRWPRATELSR